jgi:hypothetical protein
LSFVADQRCHLIFLSNFLFRFLLLSPLCRFRPSLIQIE